MILHTSYCEHDGKAYVNEDVIGKINDLTIFDLKKNGKSLLITDGKNIFPSSWISEKKPFIGLDKWTQVSISTSITIDEGVVYFPPFSNDQKQLHFQTIFHTPNGFVSLNQHLKTSLSL